MIYHYFNNSSLTDQLVTDSCSFCWMSHILMTLIWMQSFKKWIIPVKSTVADLRAVVHYSPSVCRSGWHHHHSLCCSAERRPLKQHRHVETYRFFTFSFQCDVATTDTRWRWGRPQRPGVVCTDTTGDVPGSVSWKGSMHWLNITSNTDLRVKERHFNFT